LSKEERRKKKEERRKKKEERRKKKEERRSRQTASGDVVQGAVEYRNTSSVVTTPYCQTELAFS
jgi:hypothetical protein